MQILRVLFLACVLSATRIGAQETRNPLDGALVICGPDEVVILAGTESKDGAFAAGWTIRANGNYPPVDWSAYSGKNVAAFLAKYVPDDDRFPDKGGYRLVNGVVDCKARTFTPLAADDPYYPDKPYCDLLAVWSDETQSTRYGLLTNSFGNHRSESTVNLWLVVWTYRETRVLDLLPAADQAVTAYMRHRDPKDAAKYHWTFGFDNFAKVGLLPLRVFKDHAATVHFVAEIPETTNNTDAGYVSFALPGGKVTGTRSDEAFRREARGK